MGDASSPAPPEQSSSVVPIRILTQNIRFATDNPDRAEKLWPDRFPHLSSHFKYHTRPHFAPPTTLVCMQEVLHEQLVDLHQKTFNTSSAAHPANNSNNSNNNNDWTYVGVGRNDGKTKGEYSPVFFRQSAWKCIHFDTIWLNETGQVGKKGWDADSVRILTCAVLESVGSSHGSPRGDQSTSPKRILAMNTHLDNEGEISRRESAKVILAMASRLRARFSPGFTFLCGDLNSRPNGDAYQILNSPGSGFVDARRLIPDDGNKDGKIYALGNELTFTGFPEDPAATGAERIDFVHLGVPPQDTSPEREPNAHDTLRDMVQCYGVLPNRFDDRVWLSDHRGVVVDVLVEL
ncbi:hypothetical protein A1O7_09323 [Cladophialophora yegresii CBS 114405]|uniref:Endonuclease/exonuclease/phosphatase domain-containing protein n=1 Tax=Cladophialophora yegresii CBS 114405 TaxID=1182544 RepID=W9VPC1_9EURO|nr:uncharacterized protein A1O7_09323 [Cladophialophora yegresii CBS 114405]EXJ53986.1 hypothetical protein A1O7_09323 [Cladophialophora yegresii CBS 114405]